MILAYILGYLALLILLSTLSHHSFQAMYLFLYKISRSDFFAKVGITILFFPGTVVHEMSHFFAAMLLNLRVRSANVLPVFEDDGIKLGTVVYERKDPFRGILVGIAPLFGGIAASWGLVALLYLPLTDMPIVHAIIYYLLFTITSMQFSSRQDLVDAIWLIPMVFGIAILIYIFGVDVLGLLNKLDASGALTRFLKTIGTIAVCTAGLHMANIILGKVGNYFQNAGNTRSHHHAQ
ncbi:MAG: hypothetical protein WCO78_00885 [Candidatus Roizmanbacteria bacterium]